MKTAFLFLQKPPNQWWWLQMNTIKDDTHTQAAEFLERQLKAESQDILLCFDQATNNPYLRNSLFRKFSTFDSFPIYW